MELLVRLAIDKNRQAKIDDRMDPYTAIKSFFDHYATPYLEQFNSHTWRKTRYWCEEVEKSLLDHMEELQAIFNNWGRNSNSRGVAKYILLNDFISLMIEAEVGEM